MDEKELAVHLKINQMYKLIIIIYFINISIFDGDLATLANDFNY